MLSSEGLHSLDISKHKSRRRVPTTPDTDYTSDSECSEEVVLNGILEPLDAALLVANCGLQAHIGNADLLLTRSQSRAIKVNAMLLSNLVPTLQEYHLHQSCHGTECSGCGVKDGLLKMMTDVKNDFETGAKVLLNSVVTRSSNDLLVLPMPHQVGYTSREFETLGLIMDIASILKTTWVHGKSSVDGGEPQLKPLGDEYEAWCISRYKNIIKYCDRQTKIIKAHMDRQVPDTANVMSQAKAVMAEAYQMTGRYFLKKSASIMHRVELADADDDEEDDEGDTDDMASLAGDSSPEPIPSRLAPSRGLASSPPAKCKKFATTVRRQNELNCGSDWMDQSVRYLKTSQLLHSHDVKTFEFGLDEALFTNRQPIVENKPAEQVSTARNSPVIRNEESWVNGLFPSSPSHALSYIGAKGDEVLIKYCNLPSNTHSPANPPRQEPFPLSQKRATSPGGQFGGSVESSADAPVYGLAIMGLSTDPIVPAAIYRSEGSGARRTGDSATFLASNRHMERTDTELRIPDGPDSEHLPPQSINVRNEMQIPNGAGSSANLHSLGNGNATPAGIDKSVSGAHVFQSAESTPTFDNCGIEPLTPLVGSPSFIELCDVEAAASSMGMGDCSADQLFLQLSAEMSLQQLLEFQGILPEYREALQRDVDRLMSQTQEELFEV